MLRVPFLCTMHKRVHKKPNTLEKYLHLKSNTVHTVYLLFLLNNYVSVKALYVCCVYIYRLPYFSGKGTYVYRIDMLRLRHDLMCPG